jgi:hypothetical protein
MSPAFHKDLIVVDQTQLENMTQGELVELAKETNSKAVKAAKQTLLHAGQTGIILIALKDKLGHGKFMKMVEGLTDIGHRTATTYMMIARNYGSVSNLRGVRDAVRFIKDAASEPKEDAPALPIPSTPSTPQSPLPMGAVHQDAEIVEPLTEKETARLAELEAIIENGIRDCPEMFGGTSNTEPLVVDGTKPAPAPPKDEDEFITIRVSKLKDIIAEIDKGFAIIRAQETIIEEAVMAGDVKFVRKGEGIMDVYISAVSNAQCKIGRAIDRLEWNVPQNLRGI